MKICFRPLLCVRLRGLRCVKELKTYVFELNDVMGLGMGMGFVHCIVSAQDLRPAAGDYVYDLYQKESLRRGISLGLGLGCCMKDDGKGWCSAAIGGGQHARTEPRRWWSGQSECRGERDEVARAKKSSICKEP